MGTDVEALREDLDAAEDMYGILEMVSSNYKLQHTFRLSSYLLFGVWIQKPHGLMYVIISQGFG